MTEEELTQAVNGLREKMDLIAQRLTRMESQVEQLMVEDQAVRQMRRQILLSVFGVGFAQVVTLLLALTKLVP